MGAATPPTRPWPSACSAWRSRPKGRRCCGRSTRSAAKPGRAGGAFFGSSATAPTRRCGPCSPRTAPPSSASSSQGGISAHELTGSAAWEGSAALLIAVLLAYTAYRLGRQARDLIIGGAADPTLRLAAVDFLSDQAEIDVVLDLLTMRLGPTSTLLAARVDLADGLDSDAVEAVSGWIKATLTAEFPLLDQVFLDITGATEQGRVEAEDRWRTLRETSEPADRQPARCDERITTAPHQVFLAEVADASVGAGDGARRHPRCNR